MALGHSRIVENNTTSIDDPGVTTMRDPAFETGIYGYDVEKNGPSTMYKGRKMSRIGGPISGNMGDSESDSGVSVGKQLELESTNAIKYRTCSWQKTAALLFAEYICLAIMSFPYSYSVLGLVPGMILTIVVAALVLYTSLIVWEFCLRHPEVRDVCDVGQMLFYNWRWVWYATAVMFLLNNTFIQGLHVLTGAKYLNTMTNGRICTVGFSAIMAVISWVCSLPRTFDTLSKIATLSAFFTFVSVLLAAIFAGIETHPNHYHADPNYIDPKTKSAWGGNPIVLIIPAAGTTFVNGMNAWLNISYTFIGQITIPSFIAEMKNPEDFPKALWAVTIAEIILFSLVGAIVYAYTGTQYNTAPAFGSLGNELYKKVAFSFMIPTLIFLGVLYASVSARFVFFRIFEGTRHKGNHTVVGWASWAAILAATWVVAFVIAEVIPFFSDLLSLMSSLFDSFIGFIFWGVAYLRMRRADYGPGWYHRRGIRGIWGLTLNVIIILIGIYMLGAGTYASVDSIILNYQSGSVVGVFSCVSNGLTHMMKYHQAAVTLERSAVSCRVSPRALDLRFLPLAPIIRSHSTGNAFCDGNYSPGHKPMYRKGCHQAVIVPPFSHRRYSSSTSPPIPPSSQPSSTEEPLKRTALYDLHVDHGGKMVPFAGYSMPVQYSDLSVGESHKWTREKASLFDVGHMVQHLMTGPKVADFLETVTPSSVKDLKVRQSTLSCLLHPSTGGIVDDLMISRVSEEVHYLVTNAGCRIKDLAYLTSELESGGYTSNDVSWEVLHSSALIALQGPLSAEILESVVYDSSIKDLYFGQCRFVSLRFADGSASQQVLVSRGGYTGEDGFEISIQGAHSGIASNSGTLQNDESLSKEDIGKIVRLLLNSGGKDRLRFAGLGARDSLRLEAGMCLYGHDLDDSTTPVEAGLSWIISPLRRKTGGFNGAETILQQLKPKKECGGVQRRRIGLIVDEAPAREGAEITNETGDVVGKVTSGCPSPTLGKNIAMGYVKDGSHKAGTELGVLVRKKRRRAIVTKMPFVSAKYWRETKGTAPG